MLILQLGNAMSDDNWTMETFKQDNVANGLTDGRSKAL